MRGVDMNKLIISTLLLVSVPLQAHGIVYFRSTDSGSLVAIHADQLKDCRKVIYRTSAKDELPLEHKRILLKELVRGETVNNKEAVIDRLLQNPGYCSYGENGENILK